MNNYQELFDAYVKEMREAVAKANTWWTELQAKESREARSGTIGSRARPALQDRWPFGAVSHPYVIDCYRKWSLACEALNEELESDEDEDDDDSEDGDESDWGDDEEKETDDLAALEAPVEARELLIDMLPGRADDLAEALALFVFDPVGMDKDDHLV